MHPPDQLLTPSGYLLRAYVESDAPSLVRHANNPKIARNMFDGFPHPYGLSEALKWLELSRNAEGKGIHFAIELEGEVAGGIGLSFHTDVRRKSAAIGYWLGETFWGRGICSEAVATLVPWTFKNLDIARIEAHVMAWNPASMRVLEKCGFAREGQLKNYYFKAGELVDSVLFACCAPANGSSSSRILDI